MTNTNMKRQRLNRAIHHYELKISIKANYMWCAIDEEIKARYKKEIIYLQHVLNTYKEKLKELKKTLDK